MKAFFLAFALLFVTMPAFAVTGTDAAPGQSCAVPHAVTMTANPSGQGGYVLTCEGGQWIAQITAAAPTTGSQVTTKSYVDTAVAAAAGGGDSVPLGGGTCYYALTGASCGTGFQQMPGNMAFYSGGTAIICCSGGTSSGDTTPTAFDFPDTGPVTPGTSYGWNALQITGFDSAPISVSGQPTLQYRICADAGCSNVIKSWKSAVDIINNDEYLQIRVTAATRGTVTITVGETTDTAFIDARWTVFATSGTWSGNLGGLSGADSKCQAAASAASLPGTYRAWLSGDGDNEVRDRFETVGTSLPFYLTDGTTKVADDWSDLTDGSLEAPINKDENGAGVSSSYVWTNTDSDGSAVYTTASNNCSLFTSSSGAYGGYAGYTAYPNINWTQYNHTSCSSSGFRLYCFQTQ
jgi:hypothetical protein